MPTSPFPNHHLKKKKQCCQSAQEILSHTGRSLSDPDGSDTGIPGFPSSADSFEAFDAVARDNRPGSARGIGILRACSARPRQ